MRRAGAHAWGAMAIAGALVCIVTCGSPLREDEFTCEEAHAHLVECCPGFTTDSQYCTYDSGCDSRQFPALVASESTCILRSSCDELRANGVCARAAAVHEQHFETGVARAQGVCP